MFQRITTQYKQRGVALITALLILTIAATAAAYLTQQSQLTIRRSGNIINSNKAYLYALGAEKLAMIALHEDFKDDPNVDHPDENWAAPQIFEVEDSAGYVAGQITDLQGKFNLNNLVKDNKLDTTSTSRFDQLMKTFRIDPNFTSAIIDWIDADVRDPTGPGGAENDYYLGLNPPYHAANRNIVSLTELRMIRGIGEDENLPQLMKHVTALPERTPINVNMASSVVLSAIERKSVPINQAISDPLTQDATTADIAFKSTEQRQQQEQVSRKIYDKVDDFLTENGLKDGEQGFSRQDLSVKSSYFLVEIEAKVDRGRAVVKSVLHRDDKGKIRVVMRTQGTL